MDWERLYRENYRFLTARKLLAYAISACAALFSHPIGIPIISRFMIIGYIRLLACD